MSYSLKEVTKNFSKELYKKTKIPNYKNKRLNILIKMSKILKMNIRISHTLEMIEQQLGWVQRQKLLFNQQKDPFTILLKKIKKNQFP